MSKTRIWLVVLGVPAAWAAVNSLMYAADTTNRHRAESAWFIFSAALLIVAVYSISRERTTVERTPFASVPLAIIGLVASLAMAFALYFPMLSIGLLSDDFVLVARARAGTLVDASWDYLRPLPIGIWSVLSRLAGATATPVALHALNIGLHGINGWLTGILATRIGLAPRSAALAAMLFLVFPASVEAVVWVSGIFDVLLVTFLLAACISLTSATQGAAQSIAIAGLTIAALATKETAVVIPALLVIAACASSPVSLKRVAIPIAASVVLVGLYIAVRLVSGFAAAPPSGEFTGYTAKELFSRPFGGLGLPFHVEVLTAAPWIPFALALYWPALFLISAPRWHQHQRDGRTIVALAAWVIVSVAPLATMLYVADDLQGARYLYLGTVAWSVMIAVLMQRLQPALRLVATVPLLVLFALATRAHQSPWIAAAVERDRVLDAYRNGRPPCTPTGIRGLPDQVRGAYVLRNGVTEAFVSVAPSTVGTPPCALTWDGTRFIQQ